MKFDDILHLVQTGNAIISVASGNPLLAVSLEGGVRLLKIAHDAFVSGRERGEWTTEECERFDKEVLPTITSQPHWQKKA